MGEKQQRTRQSYITELIVYIALFLGGTVLGAVVTRQGLMSGILFGYVIAAIVAGWRVLTEHDAAFWHIPLIGFVAKLFVSALIGGVCLVYRVFSTIDHALFIRW